MSKRVRRAAKPRDEYTAIRMERDLYEKAKRRAGSRRQTYSEYVRQLIVEDCGNGSKLEAVA
jgi:hypothetical protein